MSTVEQRAAAYLQNLLKNPGMWIRIRKSKNSQKSKRVNSAERKETFEAIITALKVMNIPYDLREGKLYALCVRKET